VYIDRSIIFLWLVYWLFCVVGWKWLRNRGDLAQRVIRVPTVISAAPSFIHHAGYHPLAVWVESTWIVTVLPTRLFAWIIASDADDCVACCNEVNCASCAAMAVSDCGFIGS